MPKQNRPVGTAVISALPNVCVVLLVKVLVDKVLEFLGLKTKGNKRSVSFGVGPAPAVSPVRAK